MAAEIIQSITDLAVDEIELGLSGRLRPVSRAGVEALKSSIRALGVIKDPIHVRKLKGGKIRLIAGGHRLTAARELRDEGEEGFDTIKVTCWRCSDDFARLMEIDDNLAGAELNPLDTAVFLAQRKEVYERMHPEARAAVGAALASRRWDAADTVSVASFAEAVAEQMGVTERHVRRLVKVGTALGPDEVAKLRTAPKQVGTVDLITLSKIDNSVERYDAVDLIAKGEAKNASAAVKAVRIARDGAPPALSDADQKLLRLMDAWDRANGKTRQAFVEQRGEEIRRWLDAVEGGEL